MTIYYLSNYSKYVEGLLINISHFYIHHGLDPTYSILYDHPPFHSLTAICGLHCCLFVPIVKEMLGRLCEPINSHERIMLYYAATACMSTEKQNNAKFSCIIDLNFIYLLKNCPILRGNLLHPGMKAPKYN